MSSVGPQRNGSSDQRVGECTAPLPRAVTWRRGGNRESGDIRVAGEVGGGGGGPGPNAQVCAVLAEQLTHNAGRWDAKGDGTD